MNFRTKPAVVRSCAKVNLALDVLGARPDGYHAIESVMQTVGLHDTISLTVRESEGIRLSCDMPGIPTDESNLAHRAASVLLGAHRISTGLDITIEKRIPAQAGLGGGSSNAAAVLMGLDHLLGLSMPQDQMCDLAAQIGSDVPFFLIGGTAFVCGRGEHVRSLPDVPPMWMVVVKPPFGVSTPWSYRRLDEMRAAGGQLPITSERETASRRIVECMEQDTLRSAVCSLQSLVSNDLEAPAIEQHPEIAQIKDALVALGARAALMCGSGSAVFGLFETEAQAESCSERLRSAMEAPLLTKEGWPKAGEVRTPSTLRVGPPYQGGQLFITRTITREEALKIE